MLGSPLNRDLIGRSIGLAAFQQGDASWRILPRTASHTVLSVVLSYWKVEPTTKRAARLLALPAGALHSQRDDGWTKHSVPDHFFRSCSIWVVRRDLLIARSRDMVWTPFQYRRLRHRTSSWNLFLGSSRKRSNARQRKSGSFWCFPEDLGGLLDSGPTSVWALQEFKSQGGLRGAAYLCQFGDSDHMRPLDIFSNLENVCTSIHRGWPNLVSTVIDHSPTLSYTGQLQQKTCPCVKTHKALMKGTSSDGLFLSQSATSFSSKFWKQCFSGLRIANSLGRERRVGTQFLTESNHRNKRGFHLWPQECHRSVFSTST